MRAAYEIMARRGFDGFGVQDITQAAGVGYGSFYNHFTSKETITAAVIEAARERMMAMFGARQPRTKDRAAALAVHLRLWLHMSRLDPEWGWFALRAVLTDLRMALAAPLEAAIEAGVADGSFAPQDAAMARESVGGLMLLATLRLVSSPVEADYPDRVVATCLSALGVGGDKIAAVMAMPLPLLDVPSFLGPPAA
jgi:AcrR family transcriptional regulator